VIAMMQSARPAAGKWFAASVAAVLVAVAVSQVMTQQMRSLASQIQWTLELDTKVAAQRDAYGGGKVPTIRDESAWYLPDAPQRDPRRQKPRDVFLANRRIGSAGFSKVEKYLMSENPILGLFGRCARSSTKRNRCRNFWKR
jgi:hypothetical protein